MFTTHVYFHPSLCFQAEELLKRKEQVAADQKLVERLVKLFYWPAKMSVVQPAEQEVLFQSDEVEQDGDTISANNPFDSTEIITRAAAKTMGTAVERSGQSTAPVNLSHARIPSVMSVYSDYSVSSPATPVTKTYSRKRPAPALGLNFQDLIQNPAKKACEDGDNTTFKPPQPRAVQTPRILQVPDSPRLLGTSPSPQSGLGPPFSSYPPSPSLPNPALRIVSSDPARISSTPLRSSANLRRKLPE